MSPGTRFRRHPRPILGLGGQPRRSGPGLFGQLFGAAAQHDQRAAERRPARAGAQENLNVSFETFLLLSVSRNLPSACL